MLFLFIVYFVLFFVLLLSLESQNAASLNSVAVNRSARLFPGIPLLRCPSLRPQLVVVSAQAIWMHQVDMSCPAPLEFSGLRALINNLS